MRFLVDENLPRSAAHILREHGHDAVWVSESEFRGQPDERVIEECNRQGRILVTLDLGIPGAVPGVRTGIVLLRTPSNFNQRQIAALLDRLLSSAATSDLEGAITVVSPGRVRRRPLA